MLRLYENVGIREIVILSPPRRTKDLPRCLELLAAVVAFWPEMER